MPTHKRTKLGTAITLAVIASQHAIGVQAATQLFQGIEEVVVTAQKTEESLQDVPIALSAFDSGDIENRGISEIKDIGLAVPSLQIPAFPTTNDNLGFFIRGVGNADSNILTRDNSVGVYVDGVYLGRTTGVLADLVDLERIEVLRGPQGTLYGRNTTAGAVNLVSARPGGEFGIKQEVSVGNYEYWRSRTTLNLPDIGGLKAKISYIQSDREGWVENDGPNKVAGTDYEDFNLSKQEGVRLVAAFDPKDSLAIDYAFDYSDIDSTHAYFQYGGPAPLTSNTGDAGPLDVTVSFPDRIEKSKSHITGDDFAYELPLSNTITQGHSLTLTWDIDDTTTVKSITGYRKIDSSQFANFSSGFIVGDVPIGGVAAGALNFGAEIDIDDEQFTQEFQITSRTDTMTYVAGIYYLDETGSYAERQVQQYNTHTSGGGAQPITTVDSGLFEVKSEVESIAVYGQATWSASDALDLTLGIRYTKDDRPSERLVRSVGVFDSPTFGTFPNVGFPAGEHDVEVENVDYIATANYSFNEDISSYLKFSTGFRSGGSNPRAADYSIGYEEETVETWELGLKSQLFENRVRLNTAVFLSDYEDFILDFTNPANQGQVTGINAGEGEISGFETEILIVPTGNVQIGLSYTYLDTDMESEDPEDPSLVKGVDEFVFLWAPRHAYSANVDLTLANFDNGALSTHINYGWQDAQFAATGTANVVTDSFGQLNWRLKLDEVESGDALLGFALWITNLTDNADPAYNLLGTGFAYQEPRRYGADVKIEF